jgi:hypothetical protein
MSANQAVFPIAAMARVLGVSTAGYYAWCSRPPSTRSAVDETLLKRVRTIHVVSRGTYGAPRVHAELRAEGCAVGKKRIARLMRTAVIVGVSRRIVGWSMETHLLTELVLAALEMAIVQRKPHKIIHHSDQGSQAGLKWSSQHHEWGSCDDERQATFGSVCSGAIVLTRSPVGGRTRSGVRWPPS